MRRTFTLTLRENLDLNILFIYRDVIFRILSTVSLARRKGLESYF